MLQQTVNKLFTCRNVNLSPSFNILTKCFKFNHNIVSSFFPLVLSNKKTCASCSFQRTISTNPSSRMSTVSNSGKPHVLRLGDYDCIGFDLDHTLCEYNISCSVEMEYSVLANFLVKEKGYDEKYLLQPLDKHSVDFLQKGLVLDFSRGNLLKIGENGYVCKASHGTRFMTEEEIINTYGSDRKWDIASEFCKNMLVAWNGPLSERIRAMLDHFSMPALLVFARIIDSLDYKLGKPADVYDIWPDVLEGIHNMYDRKHFNRNEVGYFQNVKSNPKKFIKQCTPELLEWLKKIKESKLIFLITGSNYDYASLVAETGLGKDWRNLFDIVICFARKPGFFISCRPFIKLDGFQETDPIDGRDLELEKVYSQGNWQELYQFFGTKLGKNKPKCLYFGDNLIQDIYTPTEYTKCDTVAVAEELSTESIVSPYGGHNVHPSKAVLTSQYWGSYFFDEKENVNTIWGSIINNYSKLCIPNLAVLTEHSMNHEFTTFFTGSSDGYFPVSPTTILTAAKAKVGAI